MPRPAAARRPGFDASFDAPAFLLKPEVYTETCLVGQGTRACRYLVGTDVGLRCAKRTLLGVRIDQMVAKGTVTAVGDNCPGADPRGALPEPDE